MIQTKFIFLEDLKTKFIPINFIEVTSLKKKKFFVRRNWNRSYLLSVKSYSFKYSFRGIRYKRSFFFADLDHFIQIW